MSESASAAARRDYVLLRDLKTKITDASETGPLGDLWHDFPLAKWYSSIRENYPKTITEWEYELAED